MIIAKLPLAKEVADFAFKGPPINESLVRDIAGGNFVVQQRNVVLVALGTGDLANRLGAEPRAGRQGRRADFLTVSTSSSSRPVSLHHTPPAPTTPASAHCDHR